MSKLIDWFKRKPPVEPVPEPKPVLEPCRLRLVAVCDKCKTTRMPSFGGLELTCDHCNAVIAHRKGYVWNMRKGNVIRMAFFEPYIPDTAMLGGLAVSKDHLIFREGPRAYICEADDLEGGIHHGTPITDVVNKIKLHQSKEQS